MADGYPLDRGDFESKRLDIQNEVWTKNLGYYIHPVIVGKLGTTSRIADIGTGTGIYLTELSKTLPSTTRLDGFDVSSAQFPLPSVLPSNVHLSVQDAKLPFPSELHGKYDFIHLRLLVSALEKHEWAIVTANCVPLLKPGGAIQWAEGDLMYYEYFKDGRKASSGTLGIVNNRFQTSLQHKLSYGYNTLPGVFKEQGLIDVFQDVASTDNVPSLRTDQTRASHGAMFGWAKQRSIDDPDNNWTGVELEEMKKKCEEEIAGGTYGRFDIYVTIGVKK